MAAHTNNTYTTDATRVCLNDSSCFFGATQIASNTKRGQQESNILNWDCSSIDDLCKDLDISSPTRSLSPKRIGLNRNARDRGHFINPVLKPIENLNQWNLVKVAQKDDTMLAGRNVKKSNVRDRKHHTNPVLNPIENLAQWKIAKVKRVTFAL
ncbi:hypothetical protein L195_g013834 [Trifolium pratense]|uniref:Uncharacterized protein n=1 Tax=Trifolium pratense TaxID=57577 RepID=A0A2K3PP94_TRIPR|nr:hypothetical protein L195_g013834 [Trifolium pratense]